MKGQKKVVVALSGGKDSTASTLILKEQGYDVHTLTMRIGLENEEERLEKIENLTKVLNVPWTLIDLRSEFKTKVIDYFIQSYADNLTPNPCTICNNEIKFNLLMKGALKNIEADYYATGHYAKILNINSQHFLTEPQDKNKSQIYFLSMIGPKVLERTLFPIADFTIDEVRQKVKDLPLANKKESQDVCFLNDKKLIGFLKKHLPKQYFKPGYFLNIHGHKIGTHQGAVYFTIGQRRGIRYSSDRKLYVIKKDVKQNTITLGEEKFLYSRMIKVIKPVFWREIRIGETLNAKFRYQSPFFNAIINEVTDDHLIALFSEPAKAITPGQIAAFYDKNLIVAGGIIT